MLCLPRILTIGLDGLHAQPVPGALALPGVRCERVSREELPKDWTIHESADGRETTRLTLDAQGTLILDRSRSTLAQKPHKTPITRTVLLREVWLIVDGSAVECGVNGWWLSGRIYPENA